MPRDPRMPVDDQQQYKVAFPPITNHGEFLARWERPQQWCFQNVAHDRGHVWSRRKDPITEALEFSFSDAATAVEFTLRFR